MDDKKFEEMLIAATNSFKAVNDQLLFKYSESDMEIFSEKLTNLLKRLTQ